MSGATDDEGATEGHLAEEMNHATIGDVRLIDVALQRLSHPNEGVKRGAFAGNRPALQYTHNTVLTRTPL